MGPTLDDERIAALESLFSDGGRSALRTSGFLDRVSGEDGVLLGMWAPE